MKKLLVIGALLSVATGVFAQGSINYKNFVGSSANPTLKALIYGPSSVNPTVVVHGNGPDGRPVGGADYSKHTALGGTGFTAELWAGNDANSLAPVAGSQVAFNTGSAAGIFKGISLSIAGFAPGSTPVLQVRAWDNSGGANTFDKAQTRGMSDTWTSPKLGGTANGEIILPPNLSGLTSFNIALVPEPSVIALGAIGLGALLLRRRS